MTPTSRVTCETLLEQISEYLDGDLGATTCARIEGHAASCPRCSKIIEDFRATTGLCRKAATAPLPAAVRQRARAQVRDLLKTSATKKTRASRT